jgi:sterol 14-demethylase
MNSVDKGWLARSQDLHHHPLNTFSNDAGREVREQMFEKVSSLLHDLDEGMIPISTIAPYLPIPAHRKRDR